MKHDIVAAIPHGASRLRWCCPMHGRLPDKLSWGETTHYKNVGPFVRYVRQLSVSKYVICPHVVRRVPYVTRSLVFCPVEQHPLALHWDGGLRPLVPGTDVKWYIPAPGEEYYPVLTQLLKRLRNAGT